MPLFGRKKPPPPAPEPPPGPTLPPPPATNADGLRSIDDHRDYMLTLVDPLPPFGVHLLDAIGLAMCEDVVALSPLPRAGRARAEGFAVAALDVATASEETPVRLTVVSDAEVFLEGCARYVVAGQDLPVGADTVIPLAAADIEPGTEVIEVVTIFGAVTEGDHVTPAGSDIPIGAVLAQQGERLNERTIGLLAGMGIDKVLARPRPRVVVLSAGVGLVEPGSPLEGDEDLHDANGYLVSAAAQALGCQVWRVPALDADEALIRQTISDQLIRADLMIATGGVSASDYELMMGVLDDLGLADFSDVALQPGRPQGFGLIGEDRVPMLMLPGSPVSAYVSFEVFVRPVILQLMGADPHDRPQLRAITQTAIRGTAGVTNVLRAITTTEGSRTSVEVIHGGVGTMLSDLARCNALVVLDEDTEAVQAGQPVTCWPLDQV